MRLPTAKRSLLVDKFSKCWPRLWSPLLRVLRVLEHSSVFYLYSMSFKDLTLYIPDPGALLDTDS